MNIGYLTIFNLSHPLLVYPKYLNIYVVRLMLSSFKICVPEFFAYVYTYDSLYLIFSLANLLNFSFSFFNWRKITLQCFVFCHTTMRISHNYIYIPSLASLLPLSPSHHLGCHRVPGCTLCYVATSHYLFLHMIVVHMLMLLSQFVLPSSLPAFPAKFFYYKNNLSLESSDFSM